MIPRGLIILNTGDGKGKTTAALGVLLRARGHNLRVAMLQFIKSPARPYGEREAAALLGVEIVPMGDGFTWLSRDLGHPAELARVAWARAKDLLAAAEHDVVIFDEITYPLKYGWIEADDVIRALSRRPSSMHVILTGRDAPEALIEAADLVTEMRSVKHPYREQGIAAQAGIEW